MHLPGVGTNRYAYSDNDPINKSDPNGHAAGDGDPGEGDTTDGAPATDTDSIAVAMLDTGPRAPSQTQIGKQDNTPPALPPSQPVAPATEVAEPLAPPQPQPAARISDTPAIVGKDSNIQLASDPAKKNSEQSTRATESDKKTPSKPSIPSNVKVPGLPPAVNIETTKKEVVIPGRQTFKGPPNPTRPTPQPRTRVQQVMEALRIIGRIFGD
jgi:hypothetical protein